MHPENYPRRIACLCTETVEVLYALGQQDRIVGISGFTVWPPEARKEKPKISGFSTGDVEKILAVQPDLVLAFSNLQADLVRDCIRAGLEVHVFNQRDLAGIFQMIATLGRLTATVARADVLIRELQHQLDTVRAQTADWPRRPKVYFEEWNDPLLTGVHWVSQLIEIAGGIDVFADISRQHDARQRVIHSEQVLQAQPDIMLASWCGKKFNPQQVVQRPGWAGLPALRDGLMFEIKSADLLAPGISPITRGLPRIVECFRQWQEQANEQ
ncbi:MAG: cobalamin-binding protein [Burkholderiaceae bacterium]|nr:MAG: cobalamin-binding protein [Burkholderiaceae bacterium]